LSTNDLRLQIISQLTKVDGVYDIWRIFLEPTILQAIIKELAEPWQGKGITKIVGVESRGFLFATAVAAELEAGFVAVRKPGGVYPGATFSTTTQPDYSGKPKELLLQKHTLTSSDKVLVVDDWVETGSQAVGVHDLIQQAGAQFAGLSVIVSNLPDEVKATLKPVVAIVLELELNPGH